MKANLAIASRGEVTCEVGGIAVDSSDNAYVAGYTRSPDFPTTPGAVQTGFGGQADGFVTKLNATGSSLVYSTYLGGSDVDGAGSIAVDGAGAAYVTGVTRSTNFPTTPSAFQTAYRGGAGDAFVTKLDPTGSTLLYSTYLGGSGWDVGVAIAVDGAGDAVMTGTTASIDFPTTPDAFQMTNAGGDGDVMVTTLNPTGSGLNYSTYLGGSSSQGGWGIALDSAGGIYVTGITDSSDFPTTAGAFQTTFRGYVVDAFIVKLQ